MIPGYTTKTRNYTVTKGANLVFTVDTTFSNGAVRDISTGYTLTAKLQKHDESNSTVNATATGVANGLLTFSLDAATTTTMDVQRYIYTVTLNETSSNTTTVAQDGIITVQGSAIV
jgi:hypothetical protein